MNSDKGGKCMVLKVVDSVNGETSLISIKVLEQEAESLSFHIWDTSGDHAVVNVTVQSEIKKCVDELYNVGKAAVRGTLTWLDDEEDEQK